jgi:hypothetical protein
VTGAVIQIGPSRRGTVVSATDEHVYVSVGGKLHSAPLDGTAVLAPVPQIDEGIEDGSLLANGRCLYWITAEGALVSYDLHGNERRVLMTEAFGSVPLAISKGRLLVWSRASGPEPAVLRILPLGGGPPLDVHRSANIELARAHGPHVVWLEKPPYSEKHPAIQLNPKACSRVYRAVWT